MRTLELLAPAKNLECGKAAIDHGADAVYIGPPQFGARAAAGNSVADIAELCRYAHVFDAKVYATVNTLLYDDELPQARLLLQQLNDAGVDAVLIQDMRLLSEVSLKLHASTQADNRTADKVAWLWQQGFRRAVLARELSVDEIRAIHDAVPQMELEVFVHGALCVSYSGRCYASEHCFGRSANRGECAQFCRMQFDLLDADGRELEHQRHLLSLKDLNLSAHLAELIEAGAMSFKIEGRLKDVAYVKNVTAAYSQLLNQYIAAHPGQYMRASKGRVSYSFTPDLSRTFNRGYTTYFVHGRQSRQASFDTPKAIGQYVGTVKELRSGSFNVAGTASFVNGDGLCFFDAGRQLRGFRVNRAEGNRLFPLQMPAGLRPGTRLYRSNDQAMENILMKPSAERKIPVTMTLQPCEEGRDFLLTMDDGSRRQTVRIDCQHQQARTPQREQIERELKKLGGTPYECDRVILPDHFPYFIPASQLAAARREVSTHPQPLPVGRGEITPSSENLGFKGDTSSSDNLGLQGNYSPPSQGGAGGGSLMQCRYCLRHELGHCVRHGGQRPTWREPLFLRLGDGRRFRLKFDCSKCQMEVYAEK